LPYTTLFRSVQLLRKDLAGVAKRLAARGYQLDVAAYQTLDAQRKSVQTEKERLEAEHNQVSTQIAIFKTQERDSSELRAKAIADDERRKRLELDLEKIQSELDKFLLDIPNLPHASVPAGKAAAD